MAKNKNAEYWEKRALELEKIKDTRVRATQKDLHKINRDVSKRMKRNIHYWVSRFARDNELTYAEAMRKLSPEEIKEFRMDADEYVREASKITDGTPDEKLLKIANASTSYHFTRLELLKIQLINSVNELISKENDLIFNFLEDLYKDIYYRNTYDIAKGIGAELNLFTPNEYAVKLLVKKPWTEDGLEFSERLWGPHRDKLVKELDKSLKGSIARGENAIKMSDRLADTMGVRKDHAEALLHTESARIAEEARFDNYKDLGVEEYIIVATLDHKTSSICRRMDGKSFLVKDKKVGVNYPPFHVRCRTTTAPYDLDEHSIGERAARDKNGKTIYVPKNMTYNEFYKKYIESDEEYSLVEKKWKNRYSDKKQFEKYKNAGVQVPKSFDNYQDLKYNGSKRDRKLRSVDYTRRMKLKNNPELKLPNVDTATIDKNKFEKYLFGGNNVSGLNKGKLIEKRMGYNIDNYKEFEKEILKKAKENPVVNKGSNGHVTRYEQKIIMYNKDGIPTNVKVGWGVDKDKTHLTTVIIEEVK